MPIIEEAKTNYSTTTVISPLFDRVLVRRLEARKEFGSILLSTNGTEKPCYGLILSTGFDVHTDIKPKSIAVFGKYAGTEIDTGDELLLIIKQEDLQAVVSDRKFAEALMEKGAF